MIDKIKSDKAALPTHILLNIHHLRPRYKNIGTLSALNKTWLGSLYRIYLKRITFLHKGITIPLWRQLHPIYIKYRILYLVYLEKREQLHANPWFALISMHEYVSSKSIAVIKLLDESRVVIERPKVYPAIDQAEVSQPFDRYDFPAIYCFNLSNATLYGGSNLIYHADRVLCHDLFNVNTDYTSEEMHGRIYINIKKRTIRRLHYDNHTDQIAVAASFLDAASTNYAHWLTEVLPRIAAFCTLRQFSHIPIMIDAGLHENILESLSMIVGSTREVITVPSGNGVSVGKLFVTSVSGYVPFMPRENGNDIGSHGMFSATALNLMREAIFNHLDTLHSKSSPKKVYLARGKRYRSVSNEDSLKKCLADVGFESIELEALTFSQQVALLRNAEIVVGPTGAGMANLLFSNSSQVVYILFGKNRATHYFYWAHIVSTAGMRLNHILGTQDHPRTGVHSSFWVNETDLLEALKEQI
jgi:capsular polysaccharide biosynthesis protein